ncbi:MAG: hypothetical protein ACRC62_39805 [Microcoleus sp.]
MTDILNSPCPECHEAEQKENLDINCILNKLKSIKKGQLSDREVTYLCLCLCLVTRYERAFRMVNNNKKPTIKEIYNQDPNIAKKGEQLSADMSKTLHLHIKKLMGIDEEKRLPPWPKVISFFREREGCCKNQVSTNDKNESYFLIIEAPGKINSSEMERLLKSIGVTIKMKSRIENE